MRLEEDVKLSWLQILPPQIALGLLLGLAAGVTGVASPSLAALFGVYLVWGIALGWNERAE